MSQQEIIGRLPAGVKRLAYIVGRWIWIEFETKPSDEIRTALKELGFRWNKTRNCWQHPCGYYSRRSHIDPRLKYGVQGVEETA